MQLSELRTFLTIIETGSLVRASERLRVTQSTVTARLKTLEDSLGQQLINRTKSGATMTAAGIRLRRYAQTIDELWTQAQQETALPENVSFLCNLGCETDLWHGMGRDIFAKLNHQHPNSALSVWTGSSDDIQNWIKKGLCDVVISNDMPHGSNHITLTDDRLILVSDDPSRNGHFDPAYVFVEAGAEFGRDHAVRFSDTPTAKLSFNSATVALDHLLTTGGSAYLPQRMTTSYIASGRLHHLDAAPAFNRKTYLSARKDFDMDLAPFAQKYKRAGIADP
jgi:DNA-binding transcriptional LysR family regulator